MKKISALFALAAMVFGTQFAQADVKAPLWNCAVSFNVEGGGLKVIVGSFALEGQGKISCMDVAGNTEEIPVYVTVGGRPLSLGIGAGHLQLVGLATGIGLAGQPSDLLGTYVVAGVRGAIFLGGGADVALHATHRSITVNASIQAVSGLGLNAGIDRLTIERL
jgi:hypothetical protein